MQKKLLVVENVFYIGLNFFFSNISYIYDFNTIKATSSSTCIVNTRHMLWWNVSYELLILFCTGSWTNEEK